MADTRTLRRVLHAAEHASARVRLVGDPEQLSAVGPGGALSSIIDQHGATYLTETHRQRDPAERAALGRLRDGDAASYLTHAARTARLHITNTTEEAIPSVVRAWWAEGRDNPAENLMIALRRCDVDALNHHARDRMQRSGRLGAEITTRSGLPLAVGDRIVLRRNDHANRLTNGTRATVTSVDPRHGVTIQTDQKQTLAVPREYLDAGHLQHGYAITGHQAQGTTVERAYVLAPDTGRLKEWGYVALSRARSETHITLTTQSLETADPAERLGGFLHHLQTIGREEMASRNRTIGRGISR